MSDLADLLELLQGTEARFETLRGDFRVWRHLERMQAAYAAHATAHAESTGVLDMQTDRTTPVETEMTLRVWRARGRARTERYLDGHLAASGTRVDEQWWSWNKRDGTTRGVDGPDQMSGVGKELAVAMDPTLVLHALVFGGHEHSKVADRDAIRVQATPRQRPMAGGRAPSVDIHGLGFGAEHYVLDFDVKRGVLLGAQAEYQAEPFQVIEALQISFDEPFDENLFEFSEVTGQATKDL